MSNKNTFVSVNFEIKAKNDLQFPYLDYGFLYGYGLFESIRILNGKPLFLDEHIARLRRGAIILDIPFEYSKEEFLEAIELLIEANSVKESILNIYLTPGDRSPDPAVLIDSVPFLLMVTRPWPNYDTNFRSVLDLREESFKRTPLDRFKTLSWMKNVLEKKLSQGFDDVLLFSQDGYILETSRANVFFVKGSVIYTPKSPIILPGITRGVLLKNQDYFGYDICETQIVLSDLAEFDEIFLSNSLRGIFFVESLVSNKNLSSKTVSKDIQEKYHRFLKG